MLEAVACNNLSLIPRSNTPPYRKTHVIVYKADAGVHHPDVNTARMTALAENTPSCSTLSCKLVGTPLNEQSVILAFGVIQ